MLNRKLILRKLRQIALQLKHLEELAKLSELELFGNARNYYFAERVMERLISAAIDINMHLVSDLELGLPEDYFGSFLKLGEHKILPLAFAKRIAPSTKLRNILVHEYEEVDPKKFTKALTSALKDYAKYSEYIVKSV